MKLKAWRWAKKKDSPIGLDIGYASIKLLQISQEDTPCLLAAACREIPQEVRDDPQERESFVIQALTDLMAQGRFKGNRIVLGIPASQMHIQHLRLNRVESGDYTDQIELELGKRMAVDPARLVVRHVEVGEVFCDNAARQELICMATPRSAVMRMIHLAAKAKCQVVGIHGQPMAIIESFAHLYRRSSDTQRTTFFIDIGASMTKAMITHGRQLVFAKTIDVAGRHLEACLDQVESFEPDESEHSTTRLDSSHAASVDVAHAMPGTDSERCQSITQERRGHDSNVAIPGLAMLEAAVAAENSAPVATEQKEPECEMLDCLIDELQLCVGYHGSVYADRPIEKLVFLGGQSRHRGLCQRVAASMGLAAQLGDPLTRLVRSSASAMAIGVDLQEVQPGWAVPLGLCLLPTNL